MLKLQGIIFVTSFLELDMALNNCFSSVRLLSRLLYQEISRLPPNLKAVRVCTVAVMQTTIHCKYSPLHHARLTRNQTYPYSGLSVISPLEFDKVSEETLESLCEKFEELNEHPRCPRDFDVTFASGVLTINIGDGNGTYVLNKQTPNMQIWLSSPVSGPKRFDFFKGKWIYKHDSTNLHDILGKELNKVFGDSANFKSCSFSGSGQV